MDDLIRMYCQDVIYIIEKKIYELEREKLKPKKLSKTEQAFLEKYGNILLEKYEFLDTLIKEMEKS